MPEAIKITGIFVNLYRAPLRVVFRKRVDYLWDRYEIFKPWNKIDAVEKVIEVLSEASPDVIEKILLVDEKHYRQSSHRTRHYVHRDRTQLYGEFRKDLSEKYAKKVRGIWLATNLDTKAMLQVIREACEAAEIEYGNLGALKW